jgi:hypothetical protein
MCTVATNMAPAGSPSASQSASRCSRQVALEIGVKHRVAQLDELPPSSRSSPHSASSRGLLPPSRGLRRHHRRRCARAPRANALAVRRCVGRPVAQAAPRERRGGGREPHMVASLHFHVVRDDPEGVNLNDANNMPQ